MGHGCRERFFLSCLYTDLNGSLTIPTKVLYSQLHNPTTSGLSLRLIHYRTFLLDVPLSGRSWDPHGEGDEQERVDG